MNYQINEDQLLSRKGLNDRRVTLFKMQPGGTAPSFKRHRGGTVPLFKIQLEVTVSSLKMHHRGTLDVFDTFF